jgi:hypothetical protein
VRAFLDDGWAVLGLDRTGEVADIDGESPLRHVVGVAGGALPEEPQTAEDPTALSLEVFGKSLWPAPTSPSSIS